MEEAELTASRSKSRLIVSTNRQIVPRSTRRIVSFGVFWNGACETVSLGFAKRPWIRLRLASQDPH
jgi:hypothetical protein